MNPLQMQQNQNQAQTDFGGLNPDQLATALSFATHQAEQNLPPPDVMNPEIPQEIPQETPQQPVEQKLDPKIAELEKKVEEIPKQVEEMIAKEVDRLRDDIKSALND